MYYGTIVSGGNGPSHWKVVDDWDTEITPDNFGGEVFTTFENNDLYLDNFTWYVVELERSNIPSNSAETYYFKPEIKVVCPFISKNEQQPLFDHSDCGTDNCGDNGQHCHKTFVMSYGQLLQMQLEDYYHGTPFSKRIYWEES